MFQKCIKKGLSALNKTSFIRLKIHKLTTYVKLIKEVSRLKTQRFWKLSFFGFMRYSRILPLQIAMGHNGGGEKKEETEDAGKRWRPWVKVELWGDWWERGGVKSTWTEETDDQRNEKVTLNRLSEKFQAGRKRHSQTFPHNFPAASRGQLETFLSLLLSFFLPFFTLSFQRLQNFKVGAQGWEKKEKGKVKPKQR